MLFVQKAKTKDKVFVQKAYTGFMNISKMQGICVGGGLNMVKHQACTKIIVAPKLEKSITGKGQKKPFFRVSSRASQISRQKRTAKAKLFSFQHKQT